jgi:pyruvate-formate lyase-activating enzyme
MFCTQPFNHIDIIVENDKVLLQPCNVWSNEKYSIGQYKNNINDIKTVLENKFHSGCSICKNEELKGIRSRRQATNEFARDNNLSIKKLQSLGVRYGTLCNSKCMICSHHRSSAWVTDSEKLGYNVEEQYRFKKKLLPGVDIFFDNFDLSDLKYVEFHGGEPLMQDYPVEFLKKIKKIDQLVVKFNTNLTVLPSFELVQLLKKCKRVDFLLSVDDIGQRYEILRYPAKWEIFLKNIEEIKKHGFRTMAYNCLSTLNIFYIPEYYQWAIKNFGNEVHSQFVVDRPFLDVSFLPINAKEEVLKKIANYKGRLFDSIKRKLTNEQQDLSTDLKKYVLDLDDIRKTNFPNVFAEWWDILNASK